MKLLDALRGVFGGFAAPLNVRKRFEFEGPKISGSYSVFRTVIERETDKRFGLKLLDDFKTRQFRDRFKSSNLPREGEIGSTIDHPHIVKTIEFGKTSERQEFLLLELMEGHRLDAVVSRNMIKKLKDRIKVIDQMTQAVQAVHDSKFIHRDICLRNFIFDKRNKKLKLFDFGLTVPDTSEFRQPRNRTGTPAYMAPEIVRRRATCSKVDLFALGVAAYEVLTGKHPWQITSSSGKAALVFDTKPPVDITTLEPEIPAKLAAAIHKCLEADPEKRLPNCKTLLTILRSL